MLPTIELKKLVKARLKDAEVLCNYNRNDGAVYLCGYAIELQLKYRICKNLKWLDFPSTKKEFEDYKSFKTHNLDILLHMSGKESIIKSAYLTEWSIIARWDSEARYNIIGTADGKQAKDMIKSTKILLKKL